LLPAEGEGLQVVSISTVFALQAASTDRRPRTPVEPDAQGARVDRDGRGGAGGRSGETGSGIGNDDHEGAVERVVRGAGKCGEVREVGLLCGLKTPRKMCAVFVS